MIRRRLLWLAVIVMVVAVAGNLAMTVWLVHERERIGRAHFPISCSAASQTLFDAGLVRLHTLRFPDARSAFNTIIETEPQCAMAYWGIAMTRIGQPIAGMRAPADVEAGKKALASADQASIASKRERDYISALKPLFAANDEVAWHDRAAAYAGAMKQLADRHPHDSEAQIFYGLALNIAVRPGDRSFVHQTKAAEILLVQLGRHPDHPGLPHYLTYCLNAPTHQVADVPFLEIEKKMLRMQTAFAALALVGAAAFLLAVWPSWSRPKST